MYSEQLRVLLVSIIPAKKEARSQRMFFEYEDYSMHLAEVASWNKCRDAVIEKADKVFQEAIKGENNELPL